MATRIQNEATLLKANYKQADLDNMSAKEMQELVTKMTEGSDTTNQVRGFVSGVEKRKGKRSEFLNRSISFPVGSCTVESLFISNKERAAGKTPLTASKVFCSLRFTDGTNSISINDNFDEANAEFQAAGKMLLNEDGSAIEQTAGIKEGKYEIPS